ncbi:hypothetical protein Angca_004155, partial [Angiostrongylus cantonensis]
SSGKNGTGGTPGRVGPPGPAGVRGAPGEIGTQGPPGDAGKVLNGAPPGSQGKPGPVGPRGKPGLPGRDGRPGVAGSPGTRGPQGERGNKGALGAPGPHGTPGFPGHPGSCAHCLSSAQKHPQPSTSPGWTPSSVALHFKSTQDEKTGSNDQSYLTSPQQVPQPQTQTHGKSTFSRKPILRHDDSELLEPITPEPHQSRKPMGYSQEQLNSMSQSLLQKSGARFGSAMVKTNRGYDVHIVSSSYSASPVSKSWDAGMPKQHNPANYEQLAPPPPKYKFK